MTEEILVNVTPRETRVAVVENGMLQELHIERGWRRGVVGNIYKGRVQRVMPGMQEGRTLQADVDERRLHPRQHPLHPALVDVADHAAAPATLDVQFLQHAVLDHRDAGLARGDVDQDLLGHAGTASGPRPASASRRAVSCSGRPMTPE